MGGGTGFDTVELCQNAVARGILPTLAILKGFYFMDEDNDIHLRGILRPGVAYTSQS